MSTTPTVYAVYETATGFVVNVVLWDGLADWVPPSGCSTVADPTGQYQIGQTITPSQSK